MSKQSRLNKEKAAKAKDSGDNKQAATPNKKDGQTGQRGEGATDNKDAKAPRE